jgi:hypothetical protein
MSLEVLVDNETLIAGLQNKADRIPEELKNLVNTAAFAVDREVKEASPVITGNLQGATSIDNLSDYEKRIFVDEGIAPYAIYVIKGTQPHDIYPKGLATFHAGKQLTSGSALWWPGADHPVKVVHHPGTEANDYFSTGVENARPAIDAAINDFKSWIME